LSVSVEETGVDEVVEDVAEVEELVLAALDADEVLSSWLRRAARSWLGLPAPYDPMALMDINILLGVAPPLLL
jgi:hypothetical protein